MKIQEELQALIALAALPPKWETMIALIMQNFDLADILLKAVHKAIINHYETEANRGQHKGSQHANKISAIKCKHSNPDFNKQDNQPQRQSSGLLRLGSEPVQTIYLPVMTMVQGVSQRISHGELHQSAVVSCVR